jgi:hypothetical protein
LRPCDLHLLKIIVTQLVMHLLESSYRLSVASVSSRFRVNVEFVSISIFIDGLSFGKSLMQRMLNHVIFDIKETAYLVSVDLQVLEFVQTGILLF